jgi:hypothetical protein
MPKKFYNIGHSVVKKFYGRILQIFIKVRVFVLHKPFQPSPMFASKAEAYPSEAPFSCSTLG